MSDEIIVNNASSSDHAVLHPPEQNHLLVGRLAGSFAGTSLEQSLLNPDSYLGNNWEAVTEWKSKRSTEDTLVSTNLTGSLSGTSCSPASSSACLDLNSVNLRLDEPFLPPAELYFATESPKMPPTPHNAAMLPSLQASQPRSTGEREYRLIVEQQPQRARMCGFGDKDRRPITPPPFIRLVVYDKHTKKPLDVNEIDSSFFVLHVDLYNAEGTQEVNLVRSQASLPTGSISFATTERYPPPEIRSNEVFVYGALSGDHHAAALLQERNRQNAHLMAAQTATQHGQPPPPPPPPHHQAAYYPQTQYQQTLAQPGPPLYPQAPPYGMNPGPSGYPQPWYDPSLGGPLPPPSSPVTGMFTRNLIGSLAVSANRLIDLNNNLGIWFVFQDLSIRQEGSFKLKFSFMNVGQNGTICTAGRCRILATTFSDVIQVFSAKKFPGVFETTELSKCFAHQGIKLPIRKDGPKANNNGEYDGDD